MAIIDHYNWEEVDRLSRRLAASISESFDIIVCIMRGGAIPAVILANELNIDRVLSVKVAQNGQVSAVSANGESRSGAPYRGLSADVIIPLNDINLQDFDVLIVDDVLDSGESARFVVEEVKRRGAKKVRLATLHVKSYSKFKSDYYVEEKTNWLFYPWMSSAELEQMQALLNGETSSAETGGNL